MILVPRLPLVGLWRPVGLAALAFAVLVLCVLSIGIGIKAIPVGTIVRALTSFDGSPAHVIVRDYRVARTCLAVAVGLALGVSGTLMQSATRNPLADPGLLGINSGAAVFVVVAIYVLGIRSVDSYVWFAFAGACIAGALTYAVAAASSEGPTPARLTLAGAAVTALLTAFTATITVLDRPTLNAFRAWTVGSLMGRDMDVLRGVLPFILLAAPFAMLLGGPLNALELGDDVARAQGVRVRVLRVMVAAEVAVLCGAAVAACGPIAFVGLAVPHIAHILVGPDNAWRLWYAAVLAPGLLLSADIVGRVIMPPSEVGVGVLTAIVGGPLLVVLARRQRPAES